MSFTLSVSEPLPSEIRRVARERLLDAHRRLEKKTHDPFDVRVHEARKRTKEVRAVLRLTRDEIGRDAYKRENARLRDAARLLAPVRDAQVLARMIEDAHDAPLDAEARQRIREAFDEQLRSERARAAGARSARRMTAMVAEAYGAVADWPLTQDRWRALRGGLQRSYARGRAGYATVSAGGSDEQAHDWRKRVKDLWYQLRLLSPAWPELLEPTAQEMHRLTDLLGDEHDLSVLIARLDGLPLAEEDRQRVDEWAAVRQAELRRFALELGACLYAESPKAFVTRIGEIYKLARRGNRVEPAFPVAPVAADEGGPGETAATAASLTGG